MCSKTTLVATLSFILKLVMVIKLLDFCILFRIDRIWLLLQAYYNLDLNMKQEVVIGSLKTGKGEAVHYCKVMQLWVITGKPQWFCALGKGNDYHSVPPKAQLPEPTKRALCCKCCSDSLAGEVES